MLIILYSFFLLFFTALLLFFTAAELRMIEKQKLFFTALYSPVCLRKQQSFSTARARWEMVFLMSVPSCANDWS